MSVNKLVFTRPRIMGSELELGILTRGKKEERFSDDHLKLLPGGQFRENGSRVYLDTGGHPEYATPETSNPRDLALYERAGERIMPTRFENSKIYPSGKNINEIRLYKNNTDGITAKGNLERTIFSSHESYCVDSRLLCSSEGQFREGLKEIAKRTTPFFVTRQILVGNGYINKKGELELSQRAECISNEISGTTTSGRAIFNSRMEPHADTEHYSRLHLILGDSNMSDPTLFLKYGITSIILDLLEDGHLDPFVLGERPSDVIKAVSKDIHFENKYEIKGIGSMTAMDIQRFYLKQAAKKYSGQDSGTDDILERWDYYLSHLNEKSERLDAELDWRIKESLLEDYCEERGLTLGDPRVRAIDLQFHDIDPNRGIFMRMERRGDVESFFTAEEIEYAAKNPPHDTRANIRGKAVQSNIRRERRKKKTLVEFPSEANWQQITIKKKLHRLDDPYNPYTRLERLL